ncbi:MAG: ATP-dependent zinc metalloprotease FtsH [Peptostreptococcaceae bacterium]|nr:ATP-dependent zinc metalloprotease FtsH [Peptostreptococcaceae bacterium]
MKKFGKNISIYLIIFAVVLTAAFMYKGIEDPVNIKEVQFSTFVSQIESGKIKEVNVSDRKITGTLASGDILYTYASSLLDIDYMNTTYVYPMMEEGRINIESDAPESGFSFLSLLPTLVMIAALGFLFYFMMNQGGNNKAFSFGKNKAKMYKDTGKSLKFEDVAGLDEEKEELEEIVDFLKDSTKYKQLGARIPKGILLVGRPGTGKTYVSKATAGEAGVPFYTISGSDFVEMFVGVGASRVRDLFEQAKKTAPCIIFIDEIDAVGRKRGAGLGGGNDEREQTLNQLLVEMDGFADNAGIIILAATNRPDILDPALLRPGRFDRQIVMGMPDVAAREAIFKVHSKNKPLAEGVSPKILARRTPGFSPADIENLINEAALITARRNGTKIRMEEIEAATTKVMAGPEKKSRVITPVERKLTAYHEAGHAVVMRAIPGSDPVHQVTIVPRGSAGGFTMYLPEDDKYYETKGRMLSTIKHLLAGRVAEELMLDDISTGASNDLQRATAIAREMVTKYGFSENMGPVSYATNDEVFLGKDFSSRQNYSEQVASEIDIEIKQMLEKAYEQTKKLVSENIDRITNVAEALLEVETINAEQFEALYLGKMTPEQMVEAVRVKDEITQKANQEESEERVRLQEEEKKKLEDELAKFDSDYLSEDTDEKNAEAEEEEAEETEPEAEIEPKKEETETENDK